MIEIERKFLVSDPAAAKAAAVREIPISQGYLSPNPEATVRVRTFDTVGFLTVKSKNRGVCRNEWEYEIPLVDALQMLALSQTPVIKKVRHIIPVGDLVWEVDFFANPAGLVVAEVELSDPHQVVELPPWVGEEVTGNPDYYNSAIALKATK